MEEGKLQEIAAAAVAAMEEGKLPEVAVAAMEIVETKPPSAKRPKISPECVREGEMGGSYSKTNACVNVAFYNPKIREVKTSNRNEVIGELVSRTKENSRRTFEDLLATEPKKNIEEMLSRGVAVLEGKETIKNLLDGTNSNVEMNDAKKKEVIKNLYSHDKDLKNFVVEKLSKAHIHGRRLCQEGRQG